MDEHIIGSSDGLGSPIGESLGESLGEALGESAGSSVGELIGSSVFVTVLGVGDFRELGGLDGAFLVGVVG